MKVQFRGLGAAIHVLREELGIHVPLKIQDWGLAAMVRTAMRTIAPGWHDAASYLRTADDEFCSMADVGNPQWGPRHWKMKHFAQALFDVSCFDRFDCDFSNSTLKALTVFRFGKLTESLTTIRNGFSLKYTIRPFLVRMLLRLLRFSVGTECDILRNSILQSCLVFVSALLNQFCHRWSL